MNTTIEGLPSSTAHGTITMHENLCPKVLSGDEHMATMPVRQLADTNICMYMQLKVLQLVRCPHGEYRVWAGLKQELSVNYRGG